MQLGIEVILFILLLASAIAAIEVPKLLAAVVSTGVFSFVIAVLFVMYGAVDVAFTEAAVGSGVVGVYYIAMLLQTARKGKE